MAAVELALAIELHVCYMCTLLHSRGLDIEVRADNRDEEGVEWLASFILTCSPNQGEPGGILLCVLDSDLGSEVCQLTEIIILI